MAFYAFSAFCVVVSGLYVAGELTLPVTTCKRGSDNYSSCLRRSIKEAWPQFVKGLPEFDFPRLDPFTLDYYHIAYDMNEVCGEITENNITALGLAKTHFLAVRSHFLDDVFRLEIDILVPSIFSECYLDVRGTLLNLINVTGKGYGNITIEEIRTTWDITGHVVNDTWTVEHFRVIPEIKNLKVYTSGFFDDDPGMNALRMFSRAWHDSSGYSSNNYKLPFKVNAFGRGRYLYCVTLNNKYLYRDFMYFDLFLPGYIITLEFPFTDNFIMSLVNQYWPFLLRIMLPTAMEEWDVALTNVTNLLFSKVSFSKVFP